jgi:hypothetical protein
MLDNCHTNTTNMLLSLGRKIASKLTGSKCEFET